MKFNHVVLISRDGPKGPVDLELHQLYEEFQVAEVLHARLVIAKFLFEMLSNTR